MTEAPPVAHNPVLLLAAVHHLLLGGLDHPLAAVYAGESEADPGPLFVDLCLENARSSWSSSRPGRSTRTRWAGRRRSVPRSPSSPPGSRPLWSRRRGLQRGPQPALRPLPPGLRNGRRDRARSRTGAHRLRDRRWVTADRAHPSDDLSRASASTARRSTCAIPTSRDGSWRVPGPTRDDSSERSSRSTRLGRSL